MTKSINRRIVRNTLMLYVRSVIVLFVALFTSRECLRALGVVDYGLYNVIGGLVLIFSFLNNAMVTGTQRFLTFKLGEKDQKGFSNVFSTAFYIHVAISLLILLLAETVGWWFFSHKLVIPLDRELAAGWVYHLSVVSLLALILRVPYQAAIISYELMDIFAYLSIGETFLKLVIVYCLLICNTDKLIMYSLLISVISIFITFLYYIFCTRKKLGCSVFLKMDRNLFHDMLGFSSWNLFGSLALMGQNQGLNILLNMFLGPAVNAARAFAYQVNAAVNQFITSFLTATNPQIIKQYAAGKIQESLLLMFRASKFSFFLFFFLGFPLFYLMDVVLSLWLVDIPEHTIEFCRLILLVSAIDLFGYPLSTSIQATGRIRVYQFWVGFVLLLNLPLAYIILRLGGNPESVFGGSAFCSLCALICRLVVLRKKINLGIKNYIFKVILPCLSVMTLTVVPALLLYHYYSEFIVYRILIVVFSDILFIVYAYVIGLTDLERTIIRKNVILRISGFFNKKY